MIQLENDIVFTVATASKCNTIKWKNTKTTWENLVNDLSQTVYTEETVDEYAAMSATKEGKAKQGLIKDVGGFVGGYLREGRRLKGYVEHRQLIALDIDFGDTSIWNEFEATGYSGVCYSTHKHTPESPRLRLLIPLSRSVSADEYEACARQIATWFDIDKFDDTTYQPERLMYYPSTSCDGEYFFEYADGVFLNPDDVLDQMDNWQDPTTWATSSRITEARREKRTDKAEDPATKKGIIGAFCRAFTIEDAIDTFLPEVYTPCEELGRGRYSYVNGSTFGGLVVYDNTFCYSHHGTDPISGELCNAFDLVRLHMFGHLDEPMKEYADNTRRPSFKAMAEYAASLDDVKIEAVFKSSADEYDTDADVIGSKRDTRKTKRNTRKEWAKSLDVDNNGKIRSTIDNVVKLLDNDDLLSEAYGYDEFSCREVAIRALPWGDQFCKYPRPLTDTDDSNLYLYLEKNYGIDKKEKIDHALKVIIGENRFNPVRDYLDGCEWDGVERLDTLYIRLFGADDNEYTRAVTRKTFCGAVARIYNAGCKFDTVTVLVGEQGIGKSTAVRMMARDWFCDSITDITSKDALEQLQGSWIIELPELSSLRKAEVNAVKQFVSKTEDKFRVAYGKRTDHFPRRCIFVGTTNESNFLRDETGNRRFWVINLLGRQGVDDFKTYFDELTVAQLWGEAKHYLSAGELLYLSDELEEEARDVQREHLEVDERAGLIGIYLDTALPSNWDELDTWARREWLNDPENEDKGVHERLSVSIPEIWCECLGKELANITTKDSRDIGRIMKTFREWYAPAAKKDKLYGTVKAYKKDPII